MNRKRFIRVPKNIKAMEDYDYGIEKKEEMEEMTLSEEQYKVLDNLGVFEKINEKCNVIIDDYEEEVLQLSKIPIALEIINKIMINNSNEELIKLTNMLNLAIKYKTIVGFDF